MRNFALILFFFPLIDLIFSLWLILEYGWPLVLLIATSALGVIMLRHHRGIILQTLISRMEQGQIATLFWIARYYVAAILFAFPGLLSDVLAILFLVPWQGKVARPITANDIIEAEFSRETAKPFDVLTDTDQDSLNKPSEKNKEAK